MTGDSSGGGGRSSTGFSMETNCGALLRELELIWTEIGETKSEKDRILLELERECMQIYKRKVEEASNEKARLHQLVAVKEAEVAAIRASLGEHTPHKTEKAMTTLKEQLALVTPLLEDLRERKEERAKQITEVKVQIDKIDGEISGHNHLNDSAVSSNSLEEHDLSLRRLNEYQAQLQALQKEKSHRLNKVLEYVSEVHCLCGVLSIDFGKTVGEVHPSLHEAGSAQTTNISNSTLDGLVQVIVKLKTEKKTRYQKLRDTVKSLYELWNLMESSEEERRHFGRVMFVIGSPEDDITDPNALALDILEQTTAEVERLAKLKASRMKELVFRRRTELEEICNGAHIKPDMSTAPEKVNALMDTGIVDPTELLANIEDQISKVKEESLSRKDIIDRVGRWLAACEEENWLEDYNQDQNRFSARRGAHLNLKRAEQARITIIKIPTIVENLTNRVFAWEDERNTPFMYDGARLVSILEEYKLTRQQKEEEKRRCRDQKKLQDLLLAEKESIFGSKPGPKRYNNLARRANGFRRNGNGTMTPMPRRVSAGSATPELLTPRSYSGRQNGFFKETTRRISMAPLNFVGQSKDGSMSSFASISGSDPESPPQI